MTSFGIIFEINPKLKYYLKLLATSESKDIGNLLGDYYKRFLASKYDELIKKVVEFGELKYEKLNIERNDLLENIDNLKEKLPKNYEESYLNDIDFETKKKLDKVESNLQNIDRAESLFSEKIDNLKKGIDFLRLNYS